MSTDRNFNEILERIVNRIDLTPELAAEAMHSLLSGRVSSEEISAFLLGMRMKGETIDELTAFVEVMRKEAIPVEVDASSAVDLCGTGGDRSGTFNISTAAMFIVAGADIPVLKHGNRSVSSRSGSYDVLGELGVVPNLEKKEVEAVFNETGMAFMFAPNFHPTLKSVMPARRALKIRTFFNMLGPLANPANVKKQVVGAFSLDAAETIIRILANLGAERAYAVHSRDGLDELSVTGICDLFELNGNLKTVSAPFDPQSLGYTLCDMASIKGGDAAENAAILKNILTNRATPAQRDIAELNAAFAIHVSGKTSILSEAKEMARESRLSGKALKKLNILVRETQKAASAG